MLLWVGYLNASLSQHRPAANKTNDVQITALHTEKGALSLLALEQQRDTAQGLILPVL